MANALIYGGSGAGKTVNATMVTSPNRGKNILLCSDNSHVVLKQFERKNLDIVVVKHWIGRTKTETRECFLDQFNKAVKSKKYDNVITDNLSDLFDLAILEYRKEKIHADIRQSYLETYNTIKEITRYAGQLDCNTLFTAWRDIIELTDAEGNPINRVQPKIPAKILDNVCGLMNIVGYVRSGEKDGKKQWYYQLEDSPSVMAKDQLGCRKYCKPEELFNV